MVFTYISNDWVNVPVCVSCLAKKWHTSLVNDRTMFLQGKGAVWSCHYAIAQYGAYYKKPHIQNSALKYNDTRQGHFDTVWYYI